jgi:hypothetical protein
MKSNLFRFTLILTFIATCGFAFGQNAPDLNDERFQLLVDDFENKTTYSVLISQRIEKSTEFWLKIKKPDVLHIETLKSTTKIGSCELVLYNLDCAKQILEEKKRLEYRIEGQIITIQNIISKYPEKNVVGIIPKSFSDLLRTNVCKQ